MLGPNPRKAVTPSTAYAPMSSGSDSSSTGDGLMVKAIDDIFNYVETAENPQEFRVSSSFGEGKTKCQLVLLEGFLDEKEFVAKLFIVLQKPLFVYSRHAASLDLYEHLEFSNR